MLSLSLPGRVFLCTLPTDMRKSFDSLVGLVEQQLGQDPLAGDLFVFRSRRGDRLKLLYWDNDGLAIWYKRLEEGTFVFPLPTALAVNCFVWPAVSTASVGATVTSTCAGVIAKALSFGLLTTGV